jgi:hypothetical protein
MASVAYVASSFVQARDVRAAGQLTTFEPPFAKAIICRAGPSSACAAEAARRTSLPIAWMAPPPGFQLQWLAAVALSGQSEGRRFAFENLVSRELLLELNTQPQIPPQVDADLLGTYVVKGVTVRVFASRYSSSLTLAWMQLGTTYSLWVAPVDLVDQRSLDPQAYLGLVATVKYTGHRGPHGHPDALNGAR